MNYQNVQNTQLHTVTAESDPNKLSVEQIWKLQVRAEAIRLQSGFSNIQTLARQA
jgi:hypothetical protein